MDRFEITAMEYEMKLNHQKFITKMLLGISAIVAAVAVVIIFLP